MDSATWSWETFEGEKKYIDSTFLIYDTEGTAPSWYEVDTVVEDRNVRQVVRDYNQVVIEDFKL